MNAKTPQDRRNATPEIVGVFTEINKLGTAARRDPAVMEEYAKKLKEAGFVGCASTAVELAAHIG